MDSIRAHEKRRNVQLAESRGEVADSLDVRKGLMARVKSGELTLEQAQAELRKIKRGASKAGKTTRARRSVTADHPILFSGPLVRAILEGRKTVTRRPVRPQPMDSLPTTRTIETEGGALDVHYPPGLTFRPPGKNATHVFVSKSEGAAEFARLVSSLCPFGRPGDRLWVRETWACPESVTYYRATDEGLLPPGAKWRPSIHMPRWASRLTLEVLDVRAERLQSITEEDAHREGMDGDCPIGHIPAYQKGPLAYHFAQSWDAIYGKVPHAWDANPWVWRVEFRRAP